MPIFSVIIPVYNRAQLIPATLQSVFDQEYPDFEVILVNDGSTDETKKVLEQYGSRIRLLSQPNRGPGAARNLGIRHAAGQYIAFLDSDDLWFPWTLQVVAAVIREHAAPPFLAGRAFRFDHPDELLRVQRDSTRVQPFTDYLATSRSKVWIGTPSAVIRRDELLARGGFTTQRINHEDSDLWLRLGTAQPFLFIESPALFAQRIHPGSAISSVDRTFRGTCRLILQERRAAYPGGRQRRRERLRILTRHIRPVSLACLRQREIRQAWLLYRHAFSWNLQLGRLRYLAGFLVFLVLAVLKASGRRSHS